MKAMFLVLAALVAVAYFGSSAVGPVSAQQPILLTVEKDCIGPGPDFDFILTGTGPPSGPFSDSATCGGSAAFGVAAAAEYDLTETAELGWTLQTPISCTTAIVGVVITQIDDGVHIVTPAGVQGDISCTFENVADPPDTDSVIVNKVCVPPNAIGQFEISLMNGAVLATADQNPITIGCGGTATFTGVPQGTYSAVEAVVSGSFTEIVNDCDDLEVPDVGDPPTCTIENAQDPGEGTITIVKDANGLDADFDFFVTAPGVLQPCESDFSLNDGSPLTDDVQLTGCLVGLEYTVTEGPVPPGWTFIDIQCSDNGDVTYFESGSSMEITLNEDGVDVVCTFFNDPTGGTIIIEKDVDPEPDATNFTFSDNIPDCTIGTLDDDNDGATPNTVTCLNVPAGEYQVTENNPSPYTLTDISCDDADSDGDVASRTAYIDLSPGETVRCVFNNVPPVTVTPTSTTTTATATATPTKTPIVVIPQVTATPTKTPIVGGGAIQAPSAGDGGLLGGDSGLPWVAGVLSIVAASAAAWLLLQRMLRRSGHN
jgi:hypothetical protein